MVIEAKPATMGKVEGLGLPFDEAIKHFRDKVKLPTEKWTDLWQGMHSRAFVVAGATQDELLTDLQSAVLKALEQGTTLEEFRRDFDETVASAGWDYKGGRDWRSQVILDTNLRTSYAAGRYEQMREAVKERPFWEYRHGDSRTPRPEHLEWHGLVLRADDPWWDNHFPPNGWGCSCTVHALNQRDLEREGKQGPDIAPPVETYTWQPPDGSPPQEIPVGIDPGWDYSVGKTAHGAIYQVPESVMRGFKERGEQAWAPLTPGDWQSAGRPAELPVDAPIAKPGPVAADAVELQHAIKSAIGGEQAVFDYPTGRFTHKVVVDAALLAQHVDPGRAPYVPFLPELMRDPAEVWLSFEQHKATGQVALRYRILKRVDLPKRGGLTLVANVQAGYMTGWTFIPSKDSQLERSRVGKLLYARK